MNISRRNLLLGVACTARGQDATFTSDVNVVTLLATVRDRNGQIVKGLTRDDFALREDGEPQTIRYFSRESDLPLTIGLMVDTSRSQTSVLEPERRASLTFLEQVLREGTDRAFVVHFDTQVETLQGFTSSRQELAAALDRLAIPGHFATLLYDAIRESSERLMRTQKGRKAFILLSDGVDYKSKTTLGTAIEYAQRSDTIIYSILFAEHTRLYRPGKAAVQGILHERGRKVMRRLASETGGAYFEVTKDDPIEAIYAWIEDELRNQYSIGYTPTLSSKPGQYHKVSLGTKRLGLVVQTRDGYYSQ